MAKLERKLGLAGVTAIGLGAMLGSGIFILPGLAASKTGSGLWLAYLAAALCALSAALSTSEIALISYRHIYGCKSFPTGFEIFPPFVV